MPTGLDFNIMRTFCELTSVGSHKNVAVRINKMFTDIELNMFPIEINNPAIQYLPIVTTAIIKLWSGLIQKTPDAMLL